MSTDLSNRLPLPGAASGRPPIEERLTELAGRYPPELAPRVEEVLHAARDAIFKLADLNLIRYENSSVDSGSLSLAVWEELAPVMAGTVESTNALIETAARLFPPLPDPEDRAGGKDEQAQADELDAAFGPATGELEVEDDTPLSEEEEVAALLHGVTMGLQRDVARLGERLRNPAVMADPWHLVSDLLEFRGRLRTGIGELIYQVCLRVEESAERTDVVPGYAADLESALLVRAAASNLAHLFGGHARRVASAPDEQVRDALSEGLKDLAAFSRTRALQGLRTADKKIFLETRGRLISLHKAPDADPHETRGATENLARFLDSLSVISRRENLRLHDRSRLAEVGRLLEAAEELLGAEAIEEARDRISSAVRAAWSLYGRDAQLDAYLRGQRHFPVEWLSDGEVGGDLARMGTLLAGVAQT